MATPRVVSIPPGVPFLGALADALIAGRLVPGWPAPGDPFDLARGTVLLPTRRACRALVDALSARLGATVLPSIRPLGEVDDADLIALDEIGPDGLDTPLAIDGFERRIALTRLILAWARRMGRDGGPVPVPASPSDAAHLAAELARLMDALAIEEKDAGAIRAILPDALQDHWQSTLRFLSIATEAWPAYLLEKGRVEPAERRRRLMEAEAARLSRFPDRPVVAAGSTGSIPATARLLETIARLPRGLLVLPGLDRDLEPDVVAALARDEAAPGRRDGGAPGHPQYGLARLVRRLGYDDPRDVPVLAEPPPALRLRERALSEAMRPADATDAWARLTPEDRAGFAEGLDGVGVIEAANEREEALVVAGLLAEVVHDGDGTAALITPDRTLARRVAGELQRFGLGVDDSAGVPLAETPAALLARLVADAAVSRLAPDRLHALISHPAATFGLAPQDARRAAAAFERLMLRGPAPPSGAAALEPAARARAALGRRDGSTAAAGLDTEARALAVDLAGRIAAIVGPLETALNEPADAGLHDLAALHARTLAAVRDTPTPRPARPEEGVVDLDGFFAEIAASAAESLDIPPATYPELFVALMRGRPARGRPQTEPRIRIYGLMEARLVCHDRLVLAGLVEGVWPATTTTDPWLSRSMRADVGLPAPERRIGLAAHDFAQAMGTADVWLTRPAKRDGAPTVPSRWLSRLFAVVGEATAARLRARGADRLAASRAIERVDAPPLPVPRPEPRPPVDARPRRLSVTAIETFVRDPYAIYAKHILRLTPFEGIGESQGPREKGEIFHDLLGRFASAINAGAPIDPARLIAEADDAFDRLAAPELVLFWRARFRRIAAAMAGFERTRRDDGRRVLVEIDGVLTFPAPAGGFTLTARADRVEWLPDTSFAVVDYKTGSPPGPKEVRVGFAPQLPLEAAMIARGAFTEAGLPGGGAPSELLYLRLKGGSPAIEEKSVAGRDVPAPEVLAETAFTGLQGLISAFDDPAQGYRSLRAPKFQRFAGDYDHLARAAEWGRPGGDDQP